MHKAYETMIQLQFEKVKKVLESRNFPTYIAEDKEAVIRLVNQLIQDGENVAVGGSQTLEDTGVLTALRERDINFQERKAGASEEEKRQEGAFAFMSDTYLCSANALTMQGDIYNVDGTGNRVCNLMYGPKQVVLVIGYNKLVENMEEAKYRIRNIAAPANCLRLNYETPCKIVGTCQDCLSSQRICCAEVVINFQRTKRIKVILVKETVGF